MKRRNAKSLASAAGSLAIIGALALLLAAPIRAQAAVGDPSEPVAYAGTDDTDKAYADGGHRVAVGVQNYQILRSMGNDIDYGDGFNWTYHHSPMMHYWNGKLYVICNSTPKDEDTSKGHCLLMTSTNLAATWSRPVVLFPEMWVTAEGVDQWTICNMRLGFWTAPNEKLYAMTGYYPGSTGNSTSGEDCYRKWFGVAVREIRADGTFGDIYFVADNPSLYSRSSLPFPYFTTSPDSTFTNDCELMRGNPLVSLHWWEQIRPENFNFPVSLVNYIAIKGDRRFAKAFSYYHRPDNAVVALWKFGYSALSYDEGFTWTQPVVLPTLGNGWEKVWGQKTEDGKFAVSWKPPATSPHRYPLIVATGSDGKTFDGHMLCVNDEAYLHYAGKAKQYGPANYQRGLLEGNSDIPGTDMWMAYSMSKEDIWISRIPTPIRESVTNHVNDNFNYLAAGGVVTDWNIYSPLYAPVRVVKYPSASDKSLELQDMDPFDFAKAERVFPESQQVRLSFKVLARQTSGRLDMEVRSRTPGAHRPVRIWLDTNGKMMAMVDSSGTTVALGNYQPDVWYSFVVDVDTAAQNYSVKINGLSVLTGAHYAESGTLITSVERLSFRTGEWRPLSSSGPYVDPNLDHPVSATIFNVDDVVSTTNTPPTISVGPASAVLAADLEPPTIPVGLDSYRQWERWPYQRIGARAYMRSTYDRTGGNAGPADAAHFLYQESKTFNVTLDVEGQGALVFARYNHWHGSPWHYEVDGTDHIVQETSTADPTKPVANSVFLPAELFPNPLTWTWSTTKGADLMWVPIPFEKSFRMAYTRTFYGTGYYIYHQYVPGANLSQPIRAWDGKTPPDPAVLDLLRRSGTDIAPKTAARVSGRVDLPKSGSVKLATIADAPAMIRALEFSVPTNQAVAFSRAMLRITWDQRPQPSVEAPVALFFGTGTFYNRDGREHLVKAFPINVKYEGDRVRMACYFPMPFFREAKIELVGDGETAFSGIEWSVRHEPFNDPPSHVGYFHATFRDHPKPELGKDLVLLDTRETEGGGDWSGSFVGTSFIFTHRNELSTLEGDPRFYFDDSQSPQAYGTGTEEWGGGGDYWGGRNMTLPFAGHPVGARDLKEAKNDEDKIHSAYRFLLADLMPFGKNAVITLEHGGINQSTEHYKTVTYWYGAPAASLVKTDSLDVGDDASEKAHDYVSPKASKPYEIISRYEWGPDVYITGIRGSVMYPKGFESSHSQLDIPGIGEANLLVAYPAHKETGRKTATHSEFTLKIEPKNFGVMLRRKLDYQFPNQRAKVFVADASQPVVPGGKLDWQPAGVWYLAGANTCVHSYDKAKGELGETQHNVRTSNRRFRDDEFLLPRALTEGRSKIRVRVEFTPVERPLFPGHPIPELAWSELRYDAYSYVMPEWNPNKP